MCVLSLMPHLDVLHVILKCPRFHINIPLPVEYLSVLLVITQREEIRPLPAHIHLQDMREGLLVADGEEEIDDELVILAEEPDDRNDDERHYAADDCQPNGTYLETQIFNTLIV